mmetsp:Transcript_47121/g.93794  ORF Transcript_47121/g.93794 Transcript_47121/m.93794 type:complete len:103 (+) Transcript_47121:264-572(+)
MNGSLTKFELGMGKLEVTLPVAVTLPLKEICGESLCPTDVPCCASGSSTTPVLAKVSLVDRELEDCELEDCELGVTKPSAWPFDKFCGQGPFAHVACCTAWS